MTTIVPAGGAGVLGRLLAKSAEHTPHGQAESLIEHSLAARDAAGMIAARIGAAGVLADYPQFWPLVRSAALLHDSGKVAEGFQQQIKPTGYPWGERHEVVSLAYVELFSQQLSQADRTLLAAGVGLHHRWLRSSSGNRALCDLYSQFANWKQKFGYHPNPEPGQPKGQVPASRHRALMEWLAAQLGLAVPADDGRKLWQRARDQFAEVCGAWEEPVDETRGLIGVLFQGAVTLADHSASAHVTLQTHMPVSIDYLAGFAYAPYPHQEAAAATDGHLVLVAPTGAGKTESGLAWASRQLRSMPGMPRLVWTLPYRASIDAAVTRFTETLEPAPGLRAADIGVLHGAAALSVLADAISDEDGATGASTTTAAAARKANARVGAMRLFAQRVRVGTAYQLLIGAIGGPKYSSVLLEQANSLMVLDELHAYEPETFGRLCATMRLWETLGSRVAILSATLAPPMVDLVKDTLQRPVTVHRAPVGTAPDRHRLILDEQPLTAPASIETFRRWLRAGYSVLLVVNTVATAQELYELLKAEANEASDTPAILLHSRFKAGDRAKIERRLLAHHRERSPGEPAYRGGLVVATQTVEVSLRLDFDRGASELAPIEAIAQRAGRVNRLGRHPEGAVEYRVHRGENPNPYQEDALDAAWAALRAAPGPILSEQTIDTWLELAYQTPWGQQWAERARHSRDQFTASFLNFTEPFLDRDEFANGLRESFDTIEVILKTDREKYQELTTGPDGHGLLGAELLIPISYRQWRALGSVDTVGRRHPIPVIDAPYKTETGLQLRKTGQESGVGADAGSANSSPETVL